MSPSPNATTAATPVPARGRLVALRVVAVLYALLVALASFGLPSLLTSWFTSGAEVALRTAYVVYGVLAGLLVPGLALALLVRRPPVAIWHGLAAVVAGTGGAMALAFERENLAYGLVTVGPALVLLALHPGARRALRAAPVDRATLVVALLTAGPVAWYAAEMAALSRATSYLDTMHGQYAQGAVLAFSLLLLTFVGALRQPGRRIVVGLVAASAALLGLAGLLFPDDPMSVGRTWGALALVAAAAYAVVGLRGQPQAPGQPVE